MKNAYVIEHHLGDNGNVTDGMILENITQKRFDALEKKGLVREATAAEVKEGFKAPFTASGTTIVGEVEVNGALSGGGGGDDGGDGGDGEVDGEGEVDGDVEGGKKAAPKPANKAAPKPLNK